ncbi:MAG TPA: M15 family metallopeptidase [Trueperaceae bacterium]|nr:M15 family metallopeptidase [Trueperaceae bacterium]
MTRVLLALLVFFGGLLLALQRPSTGPFQAAAAPPAGTASETASHTAERQEPAAAPVASAAQAAGPQPLPGCTFDDLPAPRSDYDDWETTVLDTVFALAAAYAPADLTGAAAAFPAGQAGGGDFQVRSLVIDDLRALLAAAAAAGHELAIQSAYRSYDYQQDTFQYWVERNGRQAALATSARPGHSEHQLGTAIDLRSLHGPPAWELDDWAATPEGGWVAANAWRFGFVMSYPEGSSELTCYDYEPWHYRYVGREVAAEIVNSGVTPRELLWAKARAAASRERSR